MKCSKCEKKLNSKSVVTCFYCDKKFCVDCYVPHQKVRCMVADTDAPDQGAIDSENDMDDLYNGFSD